MAEGNEREASQELETSVAPISGPSLRRHINARQDNIAGSGYQSPTFNINDPRSIQAATHLRKRTRAEHRKAAAPSNPPAGRSRPAENPPQSVRSTSQHDPIESTSAASVLKRPAPADSAPASQVGDEEDAPEEDDGDFERMQFSPRRITSSMAAKRSEQAAQSDKENEPQFAPEIRRQRKTRLIDPQAGARAVSFESPDQVDNSEAELPDPTQDQGFQMSRNNTHVRSGGTGNGRNRRVTADVHDRRPSPPKRPRTHDNQRDNQGRAASNTSPLRERQPPSQADAYATINATAKARNTVITRPTQVRKAWSARETEKLLDLIQDLGPKWARIKEKDGEGEGVLDSRDQVALKDKSRNMKLDYLKAGRVLPMNFEAIAISNLQIERLHQLGIEYDKDTGHRVDGIFNDEEDNE